MATMTALEPPYTRKRAGAHYVWSKELEVAYAFAVRQGLAFFLTDAPYQVAKLIGDDVTLVIYPHKTSAGHRHLRVRNENSRNKPRALELMAALDAEVPGWCTFSRHWTPSNFPRASA